MRTIKINIGLNPYQYISKWFIFMFIQIWDVHNFDDDNTVKVINKEFEKHLRTLEDDSNSPVNSFRNDNFIAKPYRFQAIVLNRNW